MILFIWGTKILKLKLGFNYQNYNLFLIIKEVKSTFSQGIQLQIFIQWLVLHCSRHREYCNEPNKKQIPAFLEFTFYSYLTIKQGNTLMRTLSKRAHWMSFTFDLFKNYLHIVVINKSYYNDYLKGEAHLLIPVLVHWLPKIFCIRTQ